MWPPGCHWSCLSQVWPHLYPRLERRSSPSSTCFRARGSGLAKVMLLVTAVNTWRPRDPSRQSETPTEITQAFHIGFLGKMLAKAKIWAYLGLWYLCMQCKSSTVCEPVRMAPALTLKRTFAVVFRKHPAQAASWSNERNDNVTA